MRALGISTALFAAALIAVLGLPSYAPPALRTLIAALALVGGVGGVLLALGQGLQGWSRRLALVFTVSVVVFGVLLLVQGALSTTLGAALRYQIFSTLPAGILAFLLLRAQPPGPPAA